MRQCNNNCGICARQTRVCYNEFINRQMKKTKTRRLFYTAFFMRLLKNVFCILYTAYCERKSIAYPFPGLVAMFFALSLLHLLLHILCSVALMCRVQAKFTFFFIIIINYYYQLHINSRVVVFFNPP